MQDLIDTLGLNLDAQSFLPLTPTKTLSIVVEDYYHGCDEEGYIYVSRQSLGKRLSCAIQENGKNIEYITFHEEKEFYEFMAKNSPSPQII